MTNASINFEATPTLLITVQATDDSGAFVRKVLTITVLDTNDVSTDVRVVNITTGAVVPWVDENVPRGFVVGRLAAVDQVRLVPSTLTPQHTRTPSNPTTLLLGRLRAPCRAAVCFGSCSGRTACGAAPVRRAVACRALCFVPCDRLTASGTNAAVDAGCCCCLRAPRPSPPLRVQDCCDTYRYALVDDSRMFALQAGPGGTMQLVTVGSLNFESQSVFTVLFTVDDDRGPSFSVYANIIVGDAPNCVPLGTRPPPLRRAP
jgi:hypothetical protein